MDSIERVCIADNCNIPVSKRQKNIVLCKKHKQRENRHGHWSITIKTGKTTHGQSKTPMYRVWSQMKRRCSDPNDIGYHNYGGRGIKVCERWLYSFENFYADMGERPSSKHEIDRIDNDGNYEPSNCRWSTKQVQGFNRRIARPAKSGLRGVRKTRYVTSRWEANIQHFGKTIYLGTYDTPEEASQAYEKQRAIFLKQAIDDTEAALEYGT